MTQEALSKMLTRKRIALLAGACVAIALAAAGLFYWIRHSEEAARAFTCRGRILRLGVGIERYVRKHGAMPYSAKEPPVADPFALLAEPCRPAARCPSLVKRESGRLLDSGYRMLNWDEKTWALVFARASEPSGLLWAQRPYHEGDLKGLPVAWCAEPVHLGERNVFVFLCAPQGGFVGGGFPNYGLYRMGEPVFKAHMQKVEEILVEARR